MYSVYCHTAPDGRKYIGATSIPLERRWRKDGSGYVGCSAFFDAIKKYGWCNITHEVLKSGLTKEEAHFLERKYIKELNTLFPNGYNLETGGAVGKTVCEKTREIYRERVISDETRKKLSCALKGRIVSRATRDKIGNAHRGKRMSEEARAKISASRTGMKYSDERKKQMSKTFSGAGNPMYGKHHSEATKKKISEMKSGSKSAQAKKVMCQNDGLIFCAMSEAADYYGVSKKRISDCCRGERRSVKGLVFSYA